MNKKIFKAGLLIVLFLVITSCDKKEGPLNLSDDGSGENSVYVQELNDVIYPLDGASPELNHDDLQPLSYLGNSSIVGLGEATHGTKEFFQLKHRIFKYLVEEYNFKIFGFECDMGESIYLDRYVCRGEGNIDDLMKNKMHFWTWRTEEVKSLLQWMRTYNSNRPEGEKIHFLGVDCQYFTYQPDLILDYFNDVKPEFIAEINPTLSMITAMDNKSSSSVGQYYENMGANEKQEISDSLDNVLTKLDDIKSELVSESSNFEYQCIRQLVRNMQQINDYIFNYKHNVSTGNSRDTYMGENTIWLTTLFGGNTKTAIWAHNAHVANDNYYGSSGSMGHYVKSELGNQYQIIGFSFSKGSFTAITQTAQGSYSGLNMQTIDSAPSENSLNYVFNNAKYDNFILKIEDIPADSELGSWISTERPLMMIGAVFNGNPTDYYRSILLRDYYDVIINYNTTTAAEQLN